MQTLAPLIPNPTPYPSDPASSTTVRLFFGFCAAWPVGWAVGWPVMMLASTAAVTTAPLKVEGFI
jgi:hypothetical protein